MRDGGLLERVFVASAMVTAGLCVLGMVVGVFLKLHAAEYVAYAAIASASVMMLSFFALIWSD